MLPDDCLSIKKINCSCENKVENPLFSINKNDVIFTTNVISAEIEYISSNDEKVLRAVKYLEILHPTLMNYDYFHAVIEGNIDYFENTESSFPYTKHKIFMERASRYLTRKIKLMQMINKAIND